MYKTYTAEERALIAEKHMVADDIVELINDLISDRNVLTSEMLRELRSHIDQVIQSDF
jgi:hypothetical protein